MGQHRLAPLERIGHTLFVHKQKLPTPWDGVPGFWAGLNRFFYPITGPAQIGAGHPEGPTATVSSALCPMCGVSMGEHTRDQVADGRTLLHCPAASSESLAS